MMVVARNLQELARKKDTSLFMCFIDLPEAYDSIDRPLLWTLFARFGTRILAVISQSTTACGHACGWMMASARICSTWSRVFGKGVLAPLLFNIFFTAVLCVAEKRFTADAIIMDSMVQLQRKKEKGEKKEGRARAGRVDRQRKEEAAQTLWGML